VSDKSPFFALGQYIALADKFMSQLGRRSIGAVTLKRMLLNPRQWSVELSRFDAHLFCNQVFNEGEENCVELRTARTEFAKSCPEPMPRSLSPQECTALVNGYTSVS
jgi:hypothetical protein